MRTKFLFTLTLLLLIIGSYAQSGSKILSEANKASLEKRYDDAIELYTQYIKLNPEEFRGYFNRGTTYYNARKYTEGITDFTQCITLNPIFKEAYYYRGKCKEEVKNHKGAIEDYSYILVKDSNNVGFLKARANCYMSMSQNQKALDDLDRAISISKEGEIYKQRAELKLIMGDLEGALKDYEAVERLIPEYKMVHYKKGNILLELKEVEEACDEYQKALDNKVVVAERPFQQNCKQ
jgi:tetratricopeptide (TPR) repeat protein